MADTNTASKRGLEGVIAADSAICKIDGEKGELRYRGYLAGDLAEHSSFAETTWLLIEGELPDRERLAAFEKELGERRDLDPVILEILGRVAMRQSPMDCLRTVVSAMSAVDVPRDDDDMHVHRRRGIGLVAKLPTVLAAYHRLRRGEAVLAPDGRLGLAADFLRMLTGKPPAEDVARMLDVCLILHAEHGFNASTFAARVTAATLSDVYSAVTSAIGALKGPLHGGANTAVMHMLAEIGDAGAADAWLDSKLERREKVMGFGHRVYKVMDPRAVILHDFSRSLAKKSGDSRWLDISERLERRMKEKKGLDVNVDFYSASVYSQMGIQPDLFTGVFAVSRMAGWVAHVLEQLGDNRLIRPRSNYVGPPARDYAPIDERS